MLPDPTSLLKFEHSMNLATVLVLALTGDFALKVPLRFN